MLAVPLDRLREAAGELHARGPAERVELLCREGIPAVVAGAIDDAPNQALVASGEPENTLGDLEVRGLVAAADVVALPGGPVLEHGKDPGAVVLDMDPVTDLLTIAVHGQTLAIEGVGD